MDMLGELNGSESKVIVILGTGFGSGGTTLDQKESDDTDKSKDDNG